jgi:acetolactate synthase I/II/III large subunit
VLISRGLATMAFALPAAIGASLVDPDRPVIAFTGDGGLMMCAGELATAAELGSKLTVVVFNDSSLAMIGVKQRQRKFPAAGVDYSQSTDFAAVAKGFGCRGYRVEKGGDLGPKLAEAMRGAGPAVVDVVLDPAPYNEQLRALRG